MTDSRPTQRALLSVADKTGLIELAHCLSEHQIELLATGGTAKLLAENGINFTEVADYTGFPEIMDGRVKTLHPKIHAGILARREIDLGTLATLDIPTIDWVIVNLYPFAQTIAKPDCDLAMAIEQIDIGGPTLLRAAAKNHGHVTAIVDPTDYQQVIAALNETGETSLNLRRQLAAKVFDHTAHYDRLIANYLTKPQATELPMQLSLSWQKKSELRYGENPHQAAAFYSTKEPLAGTIASSELLNGKPLSYNNIADADAALNCVQQFKSGYACVIVKHANPCGVALANDQVDAYQKAFAGDSQSAFGGIIAFNQALNAATAEAIIQQQFAEVILAPSIDADALAILKSKSALRVLRTGHTDEQSTSLEYHSVSGGLLAQTCDPYPEPELQQATSKSADELTLLDLRFAWQVVRAVKSNAIVIAKQQQTIGIGAGQMSRVDSVRFAIAKAEASNHNLTGSVLASDAFFPFADSIEIATAHGITAIIQPGGSKRDPEVIAAAEKAGICMLMTGIRHFRH